MFKHILVPTDGSRLSAKAVKAAAGLAKKLGARVTGVYVIPPYVPPMYGEAAVYVPEVSPKRYKDLAEKEAKKALASIEKAALEYQASLFASGFVDNSSPIRRQTTRGTSK